MIKGNKNLKFIFFGTPEVASKTLEILKDNDYLPSLIITSPDKPQGRKMILTPPPVKTWAIENNIPFIQPEKINQKELYNTLRILGSRDGDGQRKFSAENFRDEQSIIEFFKKLDIAIVVAYGKILPEEIINYPKYGTINIHYSLLPKYRGASPVESALLNGEKETGVSIQKMKYKLDSGPIIGDEKVIIDKNENKIELLNKLIKIGANLFIKILPDYLENKIELKEQDDSLATFCKKIKKEYGLVDLEKENDEILYNKYRAYADWPSLYFIKNGKRIKIKKAKFENNKFIIEKVIPEGKKEIPYEIFLKNN